MHKVAKKLTGHKLTKPKGNKAHIKDFDNTPSKFLRKKLGKKKRG